MEEKDFLGTVILKGSRGVRVYSCGNIKNFKKVTIIAVDSSRGYGDSIGIITDGNSKIGWTYPSRIIVQNSFSVNL
tara:strand:+ start:200 stop:427 length:228 start_codon:yes stop_codon:yes gene_type:complete